MSDFKYSMNLKGSPSTFDRFEKDLENIGYSRYTNEAKGDTLVVNRASAPTNPNGTYRRTSCPVDRQYTFNIDNENEYKAALAIAAIREAAIPSQNEWVILDETNLVDKRHYTTGKLYQLGGKYFFDRDGIENHSFYTKTDDTGIENGCGYYSFHKATPEEIIAFFNTNTQNKMEKKLLGYKAPFRINTLVEKDTLYIKDISGGYCPKGREGNGSYWYLPKEIVEQWEAIYEEQEETLTIGSRAVRVTISRGKIEAAKSLWSIDRLNSVIDHLVAIPTMAVHDVYLEDRDTRYIRIGCTDENNRFSLNELISVEKLYDKINK